MGNRMRVEVGEGRQIYTDHPKCAYCKRVFSEGDTAFFEEIERKIFCRDCSVEGRHHHNATELHFGSIKIEEKK